MSMTTYRPMTSESYRKAKRLDCPQTVVDLILADLAHAEACLRERDGLILKLIASLTLADHIGDVGDDAIFVMKRLGIEIEIEDCESWQTGVRRSLAKCGVTTLYDTSIAD